MLVIGVGNALRCDDGVGVWVAQEVARRSDLRTLVLSGEGAGLIEAWRDEINVVLIDAARSNDTAGTIRKIDVTTERLSSGYFNYSSHAFGVAEAIEMARVLGDLPPKMIVYGIEGASFKAGEGLSADVLQSAQKVVDEILNMTLI